MEFHIETNTAACFGVSHLRGQHEGWQESVGGELLSTSSCAAKQVRIEECANEDSRFPSWLKPSRTINCLPKISAPTPGRQATVPDAPPMPLMRVLVQTHAHTHTNQSSCVCVECVWGVGELEAGLRVIWDLLVVLEPLVLRLREALVLHTTELSWLPKRHRFWDAAFWHHRLYCGDTEHMIRVFMGSFTTQIRFYDL